MIHCPQCYDGNRKACLSLKVEKEQLNFIELMCQGIVKCTCVCHVLACRGAKKLWKIGDLVYHISGGGQFKILAFNDARDRIQVECIKPTVWCKAGFVEWNTMRRYLKDGKS